MLCLLLIIHLLWYGTASMSAEDFIPGTTTSLKFPVNSPNFTGPIKNVTVAIGREAVLGCTVSDLGQYKVGWLKADDQTILSLHTRVITHNPRISVSHDDSLETWQLRIRQLKESDRGCYMCQINTGEMKKQLGCIDVQDSATAVRDGFYVAKWSTRLPDSYRYATSGPPRNLLPPDIDDNGTSTDVIANEGDNVTLSCRASGHPEPRILWRREDSGHIVILTNQGTIQKVDTFSGPILKLIRIDRRQMGAYLCIASNDVPPAVSKRVTLFVNFIPKVQAQKSSVGVPLQSNVKLKCDVEAFPNSNNYWVKEQDEILHHGIKHTSQEKKTGQKIVMTLVVHNVTKDDIGNYFCVANNRMGKSNSSIRIHEIRITTTSTTTTTTTTTTAITTTTEMMKTNLILEITGPFRSSANPLSYNTNDKPRDAYPEEESSLNWLFPSVAPAPLELEPSSKSHSETYFKSKILCVITLVLILLR